MKKIKDNQALEGVGIIRCFDTEGRLVLPIQFRRALGWKPDTPLEIISDGESIHIRRSAQVCVFCRNEENIRLFEGKSVCQDCIAKLQKQ